MPRAMSAGLVTHDSPSMILPSPSVTVIFSVCELLRQRLVARPMQSAVERTAGLLRDFLVGLSPCAAPALTACTHQAERYISGVVDTRYKPAAKLVLVTNPSKAVISFCGVSMNLRPQRKWRTWSCEHGAFRQGMRLCEWLL